MQRFMLREPIKQGLNDHWQVIMLDLKINKLIATFIGSNSSMYLSKDIAPLVAGDYVEMMNEKYFDKVFQEEWPPRTKEQYIEYYKKRIEELERD